MLLRTRASLAYGGRSMSRAAHIHEADAFAMLAKGVPLEDASAALGVLPTSLATWARIRGRRFRRRPKISTIEIPASCLVPRWVPDKLVGAFIRRSVGGARV